MNKENILEIDNLERSYSTVMSDGETKVYSVLRGISYSASSRNASRETSGKL